MNQPDSKGIRELRSIRDTVESVWVAIVLAFVLRAFMIEAFVIPTGSMAPRLMGEHWDLTCTACGYDYSYGIQNPLAGSANATRSVRKTPTGAVCPNCDYPFKHTIQPDYLRSGDRVLVMKYLYRFSDPQPWDVIVFRNPQNNRENYIKRLVGLPGETIEIVHGDVFVRDDSPDTESTWGIRRKPRRAQEAMWQVIYDNDYPPNKTRLEDKGVSVPHWETSDPHWDLSGMHGRVFDFAGSDTPSELAFRGSRNVFLPSYGYNHQLVEAEHYDARVDLCGDLRVSGVWIPGAEPTRIVMFVSSFEHQFKGEVRSDGTVQLLHRGPTQGERSWEAWGSVRLEPFEEGKPHQIALEHVDFRASVWVDEQIVLSSTDEQYPADRESLKERVREVLSGPRPIPTPRVALSAQGGPAQMMHARIERDVYYTAPTKFNPVPSGPLGNFARSQGVSRMRRGWGNMDNPITLRRFDTPDLDEFYVLGDNSPQSLDGRAWTSASPTLRLTDEKGEPLYQLGTVPRYNLIGKAFFVYWPAGFHIPGLPGLPILPNVGRMRLIR